MGNEPDDGETYEVTVELQGPVSREVFNDYKKRLRDCLDKLQEMSSGGKKLRVRWIRSAIVPKTPPTPPS